MKSVPFRLPSNLDRAHEKFSEYSEALGKLEDLLENASGISEEAVKQLKVTLDLQHWFLACLLGAVDDADRAATLVGRHVFDGPIGF